MKNIKKISEMENVVLEFFGLMYDGYKEEKYENETFKEYITIAYKFLIPQIKDKSIKYYKLFNKYYNKYMKDFILNNGNLNDKRIWILETKHKIDKGEIQLVDTNKPKIYF